LSPKAPKCTSFQSFEEVMLHLNRRANTRWTEQQEHGPDNLEANVAEGRVINLVHIKDTPEELSRRLNERYMDSSFSKRCPGADGPAFNPKCFMWIKPSEMRCEPCQKRLDGQMEPSRPHIRMFTSSRRLCTLKSNCGGLMEAYLKTSFPLAPVPQRELWWKCLRCGGTKQAGVTHATTQADAQCRCDGKSPRITCSCAKCCYFFQDERNATNAVSTFLSEAQEQADHIKDILKSEELK
jgi:hypothetical protein